MSATTADVSRMRAIAAAVAGQNVRVVYFDGWQSRGNGLTFQPHGLVCHWDASTVKAGEWGSIATLNPFSCRRWRRRLPSKR